MYVCVFIFGSNYKYTLYDYVERVQLKRMDRPVDHVGPINLVFCLRQW
jgi:hypothetical protein